MSQPFCVDQLNPAGFNIPNVLIRKTPALFLHAWEIGNLETNMAEVDLSLTTFTSRSASDSDYDISTADSSENENENIYTEASSDNSSSDPESNAKTKVRRSLTMPKPKPKPISWLKLSSSRTDQITENNLQEMALNLVVFVKAKKQRALNED